METTMKSLTMEVLKNNHEKPANGSIIETATKSLTMQILWKQP